MFCRALVLCIVTGFFSPAASLAADTADALKRPYRVPLSTLEIGTFLIHQKSLAGVSETGNHALLKWTRFHSDALDWKFESAMSFFSKRGDNWRSFVFAPGFRYWVDGATSVTPFVRLGLARAKSGGGTMFAYGADVLLQRTFTLDPGAGHQTHRFVVTEVQAGFMAYRGSGMGMSTRYGFVASTAAYDWPIWIESWSAYQRKRAKAGVGFERQFGAGRAADWLFLAALSLRSESPDDGSLRHKVDLSAGIGGKGQHRLSLGYTRGF